MTEERIKPPAPRTQHLVALLDLTLKHPGAVIRLTALVALLLVVATALASLWPGSLGPLPGLTVDTDPENMLSKSEPVRVFHRQMKARLDLHDMVIVGVVNEHHPAGVFNPETLANIQALTDFAKTLRWPSRDGSGSEEGVIAADILGPSTVDNIEQDAPGTVRFEWLMPNLPASPAAAEAVRQRAQRLPMLDGTLVSEDGRAIALYLPITSKDLSYRVYTALQDRIAELRGEEEYFITGLPVAEDAFGVEMFIQMAISAPAAMLVIFALLYYFFRKLALIIAPMLLALVSVIFTMTLLVLTGNTVHIMSSMIPIFIMPIAVLDSVHILSQFFDRYQVTGDPVKTIRAVVTDLYKPMLYTSLTTAAGFASLALTPIPPVQVFGLFVALGVLFAWLLTITFLPAYVARMSEASLAGFGMPGGPGGPPRNRWMAGLLDRLGDSAYHFAKPVIALTLLGTAAAAVGINRIEVNDNPIRWFAPAHEIRVADEVLNRHFGGTYMAFIALTPREESDVREYLEGLRRRVQQLAGDATTTSAFAALDAEIARLTQVKADRHSALQRLNTFAEARALAADGAAVAAWDEAAVFLAEETQRLEVFKDPGVLRQISDLQRHLATTGVVGKSTSLADIVKTIYRELLGGGDEAYRIPDSSRAVAQTLLTFQNSHRPQDLWHFVTPDYRAAGLWVQMQSGDNKDMMRVVKEVDRFFLEQPGDLSLEHRWFGLTYINVVWQDKMVNGMLEAFAGSFAVVFLMMLVLMRSGIWALLSMVPLTVALAAIYGAIGLLGKDYDMPVAVLSALSLGLAVDFAIHFLVKAREAVEEVGSWRLAVPRVFGAPARAITRNGLVISVGFLPLLLAPLVPYQTVGTLIAAILVASGGATLVLLPALMRVLEPWLFPETVVCRQTCTYVSCSFVAFALITLVMLNLHQFAGIPWGPLVWAGLACGSGAALLCRLVRSNGLAAPAADASRSDSG